MSCDNVTDAAGTVADKDRHGNPGQTLTPQQLLVAAGMLAGLLDVDSILVGRDDRVEILLTATTKCKKQMKNKIVTLSTQEE